MNRLPFSTLPSLLIPFGLLVSVLFFDRMAPFRPVTPPMLSSGLLVFSLMLRPGWVVFWGITYTGISAIILLNSSIYLFFSNGIPIPEITSHTFRVFGMFTTSVFACVFSWILSNLQRKKDMLDQLLLHLPLPVLVSDIEGTILLANEKARNLLNLQMEHLDKGAFFDLMAPKLHQGRFISDYLTFFNESGSNNMTLKLEIVGKPVKPHFEFLNSPRRLVTIIQLEMMT